VLAALQEYEARVAVERATLAAEEEALEDALEAEACNDELALQRSLAEQKLLAQHNSADTFVDVSRATEPACCLAKSALCRNTSSVCRPTYLPKRRQSSSDCCGGSWRSADWLCAAGNGRR